MKVLRLAAALAVLASAAASPQQVGGVLTPPITSPGSGSLYPTPMPQQRGSFGGGFHRGRGGNGCFGCGGFITYYEEPEYVPVYVPEVVHEPAAAPEPPPKPREPYVLGRTYASLPGGCLKMVQGGAAYFLCSGDWYREVGRDQYKAIAQP